MKHFKRSLFCLAAMGLFSIAPELVRGQEKPAPPKPAARTYPPLVGGQQDSPPEEQPAKLKPDENPLTGAQEGTLGTPETPSYWVTGLQFTNLFQSNSPSVTEPKEWASTSYFQGTLSLLRIWRRSQLALNYSGGGSVSNASDLLDGYNHQLNYAEQFNGRRWQLLLSDQFSYLPESSFGYGGVSNVSLPGVGGFFGATMPGLQPNYLPSQSIFTGSGSRYNNASVVQLNYLVSPRTSLTATGSYGILRFAQPGNIDGNNSIASFGYNYRTSEWSTLGFVYRFSSFRYLGAPQALNDHVAQIAYGRKITGRLAFQLFGGPEVVVYRVPIGAATHKIDYNGLAQLSFQLSKASISASYSHAVNGGSGVIIGSIADLVEAHLSRQLSRKWQGSISFGYARNTAIENGAAANPSLNFNSWYGSAGLTRALGKTANFSLNYTGRFQDSTQSFCVNLNCGSSYTQHQIWVGFQWSTRPFVIQ